MTDARRTVLTKLVLFLLIKCQVHKCLGSRHVDYGLHLVTTLLCCLFVKAEGWFLS